MRTRCDHPPYVGTGDSSRRGTRGNGAAKPSRRLVRAISANGPDRAVVAVTVLMVSSVLAAGCMEVPEAASDPPSGTEAATEGPISLDVGLEGCLLASMLGFIPRSWGDRFLVEGFRYGPPGAGAYQVGIQLRDCARALLDGQVREDVRWLDAGVIVIQEFGNESGSAVRLIPVTFVSDELLADALESMGVPVMTARIDRLTTSLPDGSRLMGWSVEGESFRYSYQFLESPGPTGTREMMDLSWYPGPPHTRTEWTAAMAHEQSQETDAITWVMDGDTDFDRLIGPAGAWSFTHWLDFDASQEHHLVGGFEP